jgi:hypothetical protein
LFLSTAPQVFLGPEAVSAANTAQVDWEAPAGCERDQIVVVRTSGGMTAGGTSRLVEDHLNELQG